MPTSVFLPAFYILTTTDDETKKFNEPSLWKSEYYRFKDGDKDKADPVIAAAPCQDVIKTMKDITDAERQALLEELGSDYWMCPDTQTFDLKGSYGAGGFDNLHLHIASTDLLAQNPDLIKNTGIYTMDVGRNF